MREILIKAPKATKIKAIEHPGYSYNGVKQNNFLNKMAIVDEKGGAYYGHVSRWRKDNESPTACITAFGCGEARRIVAIHNGEIK